MRTLIKNGTCVTASDTFAADLWIDDGKIAALVAPGTKLGQRRPDHRRHGQVRHPRRHRRAHAPRHAVRRHQLDRRLRVGHARGGARRHHHASSTSRSRRRAARCARRSTPGTTRPRARRAIDYALPHDHDRRAAAGARRDGRDRAARASPRFKLFMAYPGVLLLDDQSIFRAMLRAGELGALICMHAETGLPIDILVEHALADGPHRADLPRAHAARGRRGDGHRARASRSPRWPRCRSTSCTSRRSARSSG